MPPQCQNPAPWVSCPLDSSHCSLCSCSQTGWSCHHRSPRPGGCPMQKCPPCTCTHVQKCTPVHKAPLRVKPAGLVHRVLHLHWTGQAGHGLIREAPGMTSAAGSAVTPPEPHKRVMRSSGHAVHATLGVLGLAGSAAPLPEAHDLGTLSSTHLSRLGERRGERLGERWG